MAIRLEDTCPKCGSHLMIREGEFGDFLACPKFPRCKFTKPLPDCDLKIYTKQLYCEKCNHTGLLPSKVLGKFSGKPIPNCFTNCECRDELERQEEDHYHPVRPEDFDFPISYDHYRSLCQLHGWHDPGSQYPSEPEPATERIVYHTHHLNSKDLDRIDQTVLRVGHLEKKIINLTTARTKKADAYTIKE